MSDFWTKRLLLGPGDVSPRADWKVVGAFNPGAAIVEDEVVLLVRIAERPCERRAGRVACPRWDADAGPVVDWMDEADVETVDPRVVRLRSTGCTRLTFVSSLRVVRCGDGRAVRRVEEARFEPREPWEEYGVEDPRITPIGDRFWITYVAVSRHGAATALASTADFRTFDRHGIIFPPENKDVVLWPERLGGRYVALHRPNGATPFTMPEMWIADSDDLLRWGAHARFYGGRAGWENGRVGAGTPPIRVAGGWLEIYHGNRRPAGPGEVGCYQAGAILLADDDPAHIVAHTVEPLLTPTEPFEREGFVGDVVFPTGIVQRDSRLLIYYGAGDACTAVAEASRDEVLARLRPVG